MPKHEPAAPLRYGILKDSTYGLYVMFEVATADALKFKRPYIEVGGMQVARDLVEHLNGHPRVKKKERCPVCQKPDPFEEPKFQSNLTEVTDGEPDQESRVTTITGTVGGEPGDHQDAIIAVEGSAGPTPK